MDNNRFAAKDLQTPAAQNVYHSTSRIKSSKSQKAAGESAAAISNQEINQAFTGQFKKPRANLRYGVKLTLVTLLVVALPLLYTAFVCGSIYLTYAYIAGNAPFLSDNRPTIFNLIMFAMLSLALIIINFTLLRPFFAFGGGRASSLELNKKNEPVLSYFIARLCQVVGVPEPKAIKITMEVNAAASLSGFSGLFSGSRELIIGLPLLACMSTKELAGVLSHEFGHFTQSLAMRCYFLIFYIRRWLLSVVENRDGWYEFLHDTLENSESEVLQAAIQIALFAMNVVRKIVYGMLWWTDWTVSSLSREMEFNADEYEAQMCGSAQFAHTSHKLDKMFLAFSNSVESNFRSQEQLVDNFAQLVSNNVQYVSDKDAQQQQMQLQEQHNNWSTHPPTQLRIAAATKLRAKGIFNLDKPARDLLTDYESLAKSVTLSYYRAHGIFVDPADLQSIDSHSAKAKTNFEQQELLDSFTQGHFIPYAVWSFPGFEAIQKAKPEALLKKINETVGQIRALLPDLEKTESIFTNYSKFSLDIETNNRFREAGYTGLPDDNEVGRWQSRKQLEQSRYDTLSTRYEKLFGVRAALAVGLSGDAKVFTQGRQLMGILYKLKKLQPHAMTAYFTLQLAQQLGSLCYEYGNEDLAPQLNEMEKTLAESCGFLAVELARLPVALLKDSNLPNSVYANSINRKFDSPPEYQFALVQRLSELLEYFVAFNRSTSSHLAKLAMKIEKDKGVAPIKVVLVNKSVNAAANM